MRHPRLHTTPPTAFRQLKALTRARMEPASREQASDTRPNAGFVKRKATSAPTSAANYKRRRLNEGCVAPAGFDAGAADVPTVAKWWRETTTISTTPSDCAVRVCRPHWKFQGDTAERPALVDELYAWAEGRIGIGSKMERAMTAAATSQSMR